MAEKYTKDGIPIISSPTLESTFKVITYGKEGPESIVQKFIEELKEENKDLASFLKPVIDGALQGDTFKQGVATGVYFIYEAIRKQLCSYKLEEQFGK